MKSRVLLIVGLLTLAAPAGAQRMREGQPRPDRAALEARFRERLKVVMQEKLGLNEGQVERLTAVHARFEGRRRELFQTERGIRMNLRRELSADSTANNDRVAELLDSALKIQRDRLDLFEAEQRELREFLTPVQRARYWGMQEQLRRQMEEMRERRGDGSRTEREKGRRRP